jgi:hypothetical protein
MDIIAQTIEVVEKASMKLKEIGENEFEARVFYESDAYPMLKRNISENVFRPLHDGWQTLCGLTTEHRGFEDKISHINMLIFDLWYAANKRLHAKDRVAVCHPPQG